MYQGTPEQLEQRLSELRSQVDELTASLHSVTVAVSALSETEHAEDSRAETETGLQRRLTELSDQLQAVVAEFRVLNAAQSQALAPPGDDSNGPLVRRHDQLRDAGDPKDSVKAPLPERIDTGARTLTSNEAETKREGARGSRSGQRWWAAVVLVAVGAAAAGVIVIRLQRQADAAMARVAQTEQQTQAAAQAAAQEVAAAREDAARLIAEAREASQLAVGGVNMALAANAGATDSAAVPKGRAGTDNVSVQNGAGTTTSNNPPINLAVLAPSISSISPTMLSNAVDPSKFAPGPVIGSVVPVSPFVSTTDQTMMVFGSGFQPGLTVTMSPNDSGAATPGAAQVQRVTATSFEIVITLSSRGTWGIRVNNPDGRQSSVVQFVVR